MIRRRLPPFALFLALTACGSTCPDGDLTTTVGGLALTEAEHPDGWGNPDCASCHALVALHRTSCADNVNLAEVRDIVATDGVASCAACHGDNGVPGTPPSDTGVSDTGVSNTTVRQ